jgi:UDP-2,3-diacylglucosamine pyrophosphatase LpxH
MFPAKEIVVISDLHLAAERGKGLFQADEQLAGFLTWVHEHVRPCLLILNGDVFDFLVDKQQETALDLDEAAKQAADIAGHHKEVFEALSLSANSKSHELIILGGNHDPELSLPTVQREIERHLNPGCAHSGVRWMTNGEGALFQVGEAKVLIEHGDQYDAWNWIDHEALRRVVCLASRNVAYDNAYRLPPGSQMVIKRFNRLREQFPWLATLQPLSPALLPLALEVILPKVEKEGERKALLGAAKEFSKYTLRSAVDTAVRKVRPEAEHWAQDADERQILIEWLDQYEKDEDTWGVVDWTVERASRAISRLRNVLSTALLRRVSSRDNFYSLEERDGSFGAVERLMEKGTHLVAHGHTHSAKSYLVGNGLYLNSGTWGLLTRLPDGGAPEETWGDFLTGLKEGRAETFSRPTFIRISEGGGKTTATLFEWRHGKPEPQAAWYFANSCWQKEE